MKKNKYKQLAGTVLVVEDDERILELVSFNMKQEGYNVFQAKNLTECITYLEKNSQIDVVLLDVMLPEGLSHHFLEQIIRPDGIPQVIMITASGSVEYAVEAMKNGAYDYLQKPFEFDRLIALTKRAKGQVDASREIIRLREELESKYEFGNIIGNNRKMKDVFKIISQVASSKVSVLILGESGTGKELIAKAIHYNSPRKNKPFVVVNSAAIPESLIESELFGHEKGSFTGATGQHIGKFEQSAGGTLFLDEIGDMPLKTQIKILRVLQEKEITRVGGKQQINVDVRIISATNRDLEDLMKQKLFREDLYFRLTVFPINVPPLRKRKSDIPVLAKHFISKYQEESGKKNIELSPEALEAMMRYHWTGNVRELENCIQRALVVLTGNTLEKKDLPLEVLAATQGSFIPADKMVLVQDLNSFEIRPFKEVEREVLKQAITHSGGNIAKAADALEIGRATLYRKVKEYNLE